MIGIACGPYLPANFFEALKYNLALKLMPKKKRNLDVKRSAHRRKNKRIIYSRKMK